MHEMRPPAPAAFTISLAAVAFAGLLAALGAVPSARAGALKPPPVFKATKVTATVKGAGHICHWRAPDGQMLSICRSDPGSYDDVVRTKADYRAKDVAYARPDHVPELYPSYVKRGTAKISGSERHSVTYVDMGGLPHTCKYEATYEARRSQVKGMLQFLAHRRVDMEFDGKVRVKYGPGTGDCGQFDDRFTYPPTKTRREFRGINLFGRYTDAKQRIALTDDCQSHVGNRNGSPRMYQCHVTGMFVGSGD